MGSKTPNKRIVATARKPSDVIGSLFPPSPHPLRSPYLNRLRRRDHLRIRQLRFRASRLRDTFPSGHDTWFPRRHSRSCQTSSRVRVPCGSGSLPVVCIERRRVHRGCVAMAWRPCRGIPRTSMSSAETENQPPHGTPGKSVLESSFEGGRPWA